MAARRGEALSSLGEERGRNQDNGRYRLSLAFLESGFSDHPEIRPQALLQILRKRHHPLARLIRSCSAARPTRTLPGRSEAKGSQALDGDADAAHTRQVHKRGKIDRSPVPMS
jgi:hypothetical protein